MDAIRRKEWKMFLILKDMADETAYRIFTLAHLPLYFIVFYIMVSENPLSNFMLYCVFNVFLIGHTITHYAFKDNQNNGFTTIFSKTVIYILGILAIIHLYLLFI